MPPKRNTRRRSEANENNGGRFDDHVFEGSDTEEPRVHDAPPAAAADAAATPGASGATTSVNTEALLAGVMETFVRMQAETNRTLMETFISFHNGGHFDDHVSEGSDTEEPRVHDAPPAAAADTAATPGASGATTSVNTEALLAGVMETFVRMQAETNRTLIETLKSFHNGNQTPTAAIPPPACDSHAPSVLSSAVIGGNFSKCTARFNGKSRDAEVPEAFIDAVQVYKWELEQRSAFERIKSLLVTAPILRQADETKPFVLRTDSSGYAIGAVLLHEEGVDEQPVEYASRLLTAAEKNYNTTEREAMAVVWAVSKFRGYIDGADVLVKSDHQPLRWQMRMKSPSGRLARWALTLQEYNLKIEYTPGEANVIADTPTRPACPTDTDCDLCLAVVDLRSRSPKVVRENQLKDPEVQKIVEAMESDDQFRGRAWANKGYVLTLGKYHASLSTPFVGPIQAPIQEKRKRGRLRKANPVSGAQRLG